MKRVLVQAWFGIFLGWSIVSPLAAQAHVIPSVSHVVNVSATTKQLAFEMNYYFDPIVVGRFIGEFDTNNDKNIDDSEKKAWQEKILKNLEFKIDQKVVSLNSVSVIVPSFADLVDNITPVTIKGLINKGISCDDEVEFAFTDKNIFMSINDDIYSFNVNTEGCLKATQLKSQPNTLTAYMGKSITAAAKSSKESSAKNSPGVSQDTQKKISSITQILRSQKIDSTLLMWALAISFVLGALHAMTPGHGKTLVAAYLVGQHGTKKDALLLALTTTITHTSSIYILGFISLFATQYFLPEKIIPALESISALSIFGLGIWLLTKRWDEYKKEREADHDHHHHAAHSHTHGHENHEHIHSHDELPDHIHSITELKGKKLSLKSLISLGFSGGIVPCIDALAIMIVAISINKIVLGMVLILFFSAGLAAVLVGLGIVLVTSKQLFEKYAPSNTLTRKLPLVSAGIITLIGIFLVLKSLKIGL